MYTEAVIATLLRECLAIDSARPALMSVGVAGDGGARSWTRGELDAAACVWAERFAGRARVGILADNGLELAAAFIGALYAGAAVVPFHAQTPACEVEVRMRRFAVDALVTAETLTTGVVERTVGHAREGARDASIALLLGTSGTTGEPRAVMVPAAGLALHAQALVQTLGLGETDHVLAMLPLAHSYGCRMGLIVPLLAGARVTLLPRFSARGALRVMGDVTWLPVVPTMLSALVAVPGPPPGALRWVLSAGAPLPDALRTQAEERLGCAVREGYGLTEASFATVDAPPFVTAPGTVGRPVAGVEVRIAQFGEVQLRGANVMRGYLDDAAATAAAMTDDGWLRTGDIGVREGDTLRIVDRIKDVILCGGYTVYPAEVEAILAQHPAVAAAAVVGRPDPHSGEVVVAYLVAREGAAPDVNLTEWLALQLAPYKVPRVIVWCAELPLGPSGKVLKRRLRDGFGLSEGGLRLPEGSSPG